MLRVAIGVKGHLSSVSRDGKMLPAKEAHVHMTPTESLLHLILVEATSPYDVVERDEVIRFDQEEIELVVVR